MKRYKTISIYFSVISLFIFTLALMSEVSAQTSTDTLEGLVTVEIKTDKGLIKLRLPDDMQAGDTISGSVIDERHNVTDEISGAVIEINGQKYKLRNKILTFVVPATGLIYPFILKNSAGREIGRSDIGPPRGVVIVTSTSKSFTPPRLGQTGRNLSIPGNFDGNAETTKVNIANSEMAIIAESPRKVVVQIPADAPTGPTNITIKENGIFKGEVVGVEASYKFNVVSLQLTADRLNLKRGETTNLHIQITGLEGYNGKAHLLVQNMTPQVVKLDFSKKWKATGGTISYSEISVTRTQDDFTEKLTGISAGNYLIAGLIWAYDDTTGLD
jgi:hypothetical protein